MLFWIDWLMSFPNPGSCDLFEYLIKLVDGCQAKRLASCHFHEVLCEEIDRQMRELLRAGMFVPSNSPFAHPIVCVTKKDGSGIRLCVDF